jgi:hypothetical protein
MRHPTAAVYINACKARIGSGKHRRDAYSALFTTVEYYRAAWR